VPRQVVPRILEVKAEKVELLLVRETGWLSRLEWGVGG
jgi:hypothetical protein